MPYEKYSVLIVDDDESFRHSVAQFVRDAGHTVREAANGLLALQAIRAHTVDILVTGIVMPVMEGIETIQTVRREFPAIKIVAISDDEQGDSGLYLNLAAALGAHRTFPKPVDESSLLNAILELGKLGGASDDTR